MVDFIRLTGLLLLFFTGLPCAWAGSSTVYTAPPNWNIPDMSPGAFVMPLRPGQTHQPHPARQSSGYALMAMPYALPTAEPSAPAVQSPSNPAVPVMPAMALPPATNQTLAASGQLSQGVVSVMALPGSGRETLFADVNVLLQGEMITALNAAGQRATPLTVNGPIDDWLDHYQQTRQLQPFNPSPTPTVLLLEARMDTLNGRQPGTSMGWVRWLTTDTLPISLQYRLVVQARLVDMPTGRLIWQQSVTEVIPNQQLAGLNRGVQRVTGNQLALTQATQRASETLVARYRLATGQTRWHQYMANQSLHGLKQLPNTLLRQLSP